MRLLALLASSGCCSSVWLAGSLLAADQPLWKAGTAKADITPTQPLWMAGFGSRTNPADGKVMDCGSRRWPSKMRAAIEPSS